MQAKDLQFKVKSFSIKQLIELMKEEKVIYNKDFKYIYPNKESLDVSMSKFFESILIKFPAQPIWLSLTKDNYYRVMKGHDIFIYLQDFFLNDNIYRNNGKLKNMAYMEELNGKTFNELDKQYHRKINEFMIETYVVDSGVPEDVLWDIYSRLK